MKRIKQLISLGFAVCLLTTVAFADWQDWRSMDSWKQWFHEKTAPSPEEDDVTTNDDQEDEKTAEEDDESKKETLSFKAKAWNKFLKDHPPILFRYDKQKDHEDHEDCLPLELKIRFAEDIIDYEDKLRDHNEGHMIQVLGSLLKKDSEGFGILGFNRNAKLYFFLDKSKDFFRVSTNDSESRDDKGQRTWNADPIFIKEGSYKRNFRDGFPYSDTMVVYDVTVSIEKSSDYKIAVKQSGSARKEIEMEYTNADVYEITFNYTCYWDSYDRDMH